MICTDDAMPHAAALVPFDDPVLGLDLVIPPGLLAAVAPPLVVVDPVLLLAALLAVVLGLPAAAFTLWAANVYKGCL